MAFIGAVGNVIRPFQLRRINVPDWYVLDGRIRRFAECQGVVVSATSQRATDTITRAGLRWMEIG